MKTLCFLGLLELVWRTVLATAGDLEAYLDVITNPTHFCSAVCQKNGISCLPHWTHPTDIHPHCSSQQEDLCVMCLNLVGIFPGQVTCQDKPNQASTCSGPCSNVCSFKDMCMPATFDPNRHYHPHCKGENDKNYPSQPCIYCLIQQGVMIYDFDKATGSMPTVSITIRPKPDTTSTTKPTTKPTKPPKPPSSTAIYPAPTQPNCSRPPYSASSPDPCQAFCDYYVQVCMPPYIDPCFFYYPHCDNYVEGYRPASGKCLQCINIHGLRPNSQTAQTPPPTVYIPPATTSTPPPTTKTTTATTPTTTLPWDCFCTRVQTTIAEAKTSKCPKQGYGCLIMSNSGVTREEWSCSCGGQRAASENNELAVFPRGLFDNCLFIFKGNCMCRRTSTTTRRVKIKSCAGFYDNYRICDINDPSGKEDTVVHNYCSCNGCDFNILPF